MEKKKEATFETAEKEAKKRYSKFVSLRQNLELAARKKFGDGAFIEDFSENEVILDIPKKNQKGEEKGVPVGGGRVFYKISYSMNESGKVTLSDERVPVRRETTFTPTSEE